MDEQIIVEMESELSDLKNQGDKLLAFFQRYPVAYEKNNSSYSSIKHDLLIILKQLKPSSDDLLNSVENLPKFIDNTYIGGQVIGALCGFISSTQTLIKKLIKGHLKLGNKPFMPNNFSNKIFIVHGHDDEMLQSVTNFVKKVKLEPIILHEQPNKGRTIIEKFVEYSDVGFSIVLLSPDDKAQENDKLVSRARQNVIFELGYFLGKLGRERVIALYKNPVQIPSDYNGVLYVEYNRSETWKLQIGKELKAVDFNIDFNLLFE